MNRLKPKLQYKVLFIIGILLLSYIYGFFMFKSYEEKRFNILQDERKMEYEDVMENLLELKSGPFHHSLNHISHEQHHIADFILEQDRVLTITPNINTMFSIFAHFFRMEFSFRYH